MASKRVPLAGLLSVLAGWPRRVAAVLCLIAAVLSALTTRHGRATDQFVPVVVAARVVQAGAPLTTTDLRVAQWPIADQPAGAIAEVGAALGGRPVAPLARGEPVSRAELLDPAVARALATGRVATTIALANPTQTAILRAGAIIDLYAGTADGVLVQGQAASGTTVNPAVATGVEVLAILPGAGEKSTSIDTSPNLVVAATPATAARLAAHVSAAFLATLVQPP